MIQAYESNGLQCVVVCHVQATSKRTHAAAWFMLFILSILALLQVFLAVHGSLDHSKVLQLEL